MVLFAEGLESGGTTAFTTVTQTNGTCVADVTSKHFGKYGLHCTTSGTAAAVYARKNLTTPSTVLYARWYMMFKVLPVGTSPEIIELRASGAGIVSYATCAVATKFITIYTRTGGGTGYSAATVGTRAMVANRWYLMEFATQIGTSGWATFWVNNRVEATVTGQNNTSQGSSFSGGGVVFGIPYINESGYEVYKDNFVIDTQYIGPVNGATSALDRGGNLRAKLNSSPIMSLSYRR